MACGGYLLPASLPPGRTRWEDSPEATRRALSGVAKPVGPLWPLPDFPAPRKYRRVAPVSLGTTRLGSIGSHGARPHRNGSANRVGLRPHSSLLRSVADALDGDDLGGGAQVGWFQLWGIWLQRVPLLPVVV